MLNFIRSNRTEPERAPEILDRLVRLARIVLDPSKPAPAHTQFGSSASARSSSTRAVP